MELFGDRFSKIIVQSDKRRTFPKGCNIEQSSFGFTSIELVIVIVVLAILTFAVGTSFNRNKTGSAVAADQLIADIRYVQLKAISVGKPYQIVFNGNRYTMSGGVETEAKALPGQETITGSSCGMTITFNTLGEPVIGSGDCSISLSGDDTIRVIVYSITGKAEVVKS